MDREKYYYDPEKLFDRDRKYYEKIEPIIEGLLSDLKKEGCLRRATREETRHFIDLMRDMDEIALAFNKLVEIFSNTEKLENFLEVNNDFFNDRDISYLYLSQLYFLSLLCLEMFKNFMLFYLKRGRSKKFKHRMTLNPFLNALRYYSPKYGDLLAKEVDLDMRNAFAHGLFQIEIIGRQPSLSCYDNLATLDMPSSISLLELMAKWKRCYILYMSLADSVSKKMQEGFFTF